MGRTPRRLSLVKFAFPAESFRSKYPFKDGETYVFFGEIPNMPGHCIVMNRETGKFYSGYHTENFIELKDDGV